MPSAEPAAILHAPRRRLVPGRRAVAIGCAAAAVGLAALLVAGTLLGPLATEADFSQKALPPSPEHPFGTDWLGRDMLARSLAGLATSVGVGLLAAAASAAIALGLATLAVLGGRRGDWVVGLLTDLMMGIPHIVLLVLVSFALGKGAFGVMAGIALTHWPSLARVLRAEMLQCRASGYVATARRLGASRARIALRHLVPHLLPQLAVGLVLLFPHAILHEAAITFLGFGLPPEQPAIGVILSESMSYLSAGMWWLAVLPGALLVGAVMLFEGLGGGLRSLTDPKKAQE